MDTICHIHIQHKYTPSAILASMIKAQPHWKRIHLIQGGILLTMALFPLWKRIDSAPAPFSYNYITGFILFYPMAFTILAWFFSGLSGLRKLAQDKLKVIWVFALIGLSIWAFTSSNWAFARETAPGVAINGAVQYATISLFAIATASVGLPLKTLRALFAISLVWNSLIGIAQVATQGAIGLRWLGELPINPTSSHFSVIQINGERWLRPYGLLSHPNIYAGALVIAILVCIPLLWSPRKYSRWAGLSALMAGLWALLLSFSRASWLGLVAGGLVLLPYIVRQWRKQTARAMLVITLGSTLLLGVIFTFSYRDLLITRAGAGDPTLELRSISDRVVLGEIAVQAIHERLISGHGVGHFPWFASYYLYHYTDYDLRGQNAHHIWLTLWAELGIIGLGLFYIALWSSFESGLQRTRHYNDGREGILAAIVALIVIGLFDHYPLTMLQFQAVWWGLLGLSMQDKNEGAPI